MEAKEYGNAGKRAIWFVKSLLCGYIVTGLLLLILALMLYKFGLNEQNVNAGIVLIYVISTFQQGLCWGSFQERKNFYGVCLREWHISCCLCSLLLEYTMLFKVMCEMFL